MAFQVSPGVEVKEIDLDNHCSRRFNNGDRFCRFL